MPPRASARHLLRDDSLEVLLEPDDVDRVELRAGDRDRDLAAIGPVDLERRRPGEEEDRPGSSVGVALTVTRSFRPSVTAPAGSGYVLPKTSRTRNGTEERTVTLPFASATSTRTRATGDGPSSAPA